MNPENDTTWKAKYIVPVVITIISALATLLSIRFDIFFSFPSYISSGELICTGRDDEGGRDDMTYVFALDVSASYNQQRISPSWYNSEKKRINDFISDSSSDFGSDYSEIPSLYKLCKLKLSQLILEFRDENVDFEIWTIGDEANDRFHGTLGNTSYGKMSIKNTIKKIVNLPENTDLNTDFVSFFERFLSNHSYLYDTNFDEFRVPKVLLIIISDFLHDVKDKENIDTKGLLFKTIMNDQISALESRLKLLSGKDIMIGAVIIDSQALKTYEIQVMRMLESKNYFSKSRVKKISITKRNNGLLFPSVKSDESIRFSYNYGFKALNSSFYLRFREPGKYFIRLSTHTGNKFNSMNYEIVNITDDIEEEKVSKKGSLNAGNDFEAFDLKSYERIKLIYNDFLPPDKSFPDLNISFAEGKRKSFCVPVHFKKRPVPVEIWVKIIMMYGLLFLIFILLLYCFYLSARFFIGLSRKSKKKVSLDASTSAAEKDSYIKCPYPECKEVHHPIGTKFCPHSGKSLAPPEVSISPANKSKKMRLLYTSASLVILVTSLIILINIGRGEENKIQPPSGKKIEPGRSTRKPPAEVVDKGDEKKKEISKGNGDKENIKTGTAKKSRKVPMENQTTAIKPSAKSKSKTKSAEPRKVQPIKKEKKKNAAEEEKKVEVIQVGELSHEILIDYKNQLKYIGELQLDEDIAVAGQINLCLVINEEGKIKVNVGKSNNTYLEVNPGSKKSKITGLIIDKINRHTLVPRKIIGEHM